MAIDCAGVIRAKSLSARAAIRRHPDRMRTEYLWRQQTSILGLGARLRSTQRERLAPLKRDVREGGAERADEVGLLRGERRETRIDELDVADALAKARDQDRELARVPRKAGVELVIRLVFFKEAAGIDLREWVAEPGFTGWSKKGVRVPYMDLAATLGYLRQMKALVEKP